MKSLPILRMLFLFGIVGNVDAATWTYTDIFFSNSFWSHQVVIDTAGGLDSVSGEGQVTDTYICGPNNQTCTNSYFYGGHTWGGAGTVLEGHFATQANYDPSVAGELLSIDLSFFADVLASNNAPALNVGAIIFQNGNHYISPATTIIYPTGSGFNKTLGTSDFSLIAGAGSLDLSTSGSPIAVGFYTSGSVTAASSNQWKIDDLRLTYTFTPIPIPAALWLFTSGLIGLIGVSRRKQSA